MGALTMPEALLEDLADAGIAGQWYASATKVPPIKGAYVLLLGLDNPVRPTRPAGNTEELEPGWYIYAGSAGGPGGLAARLKRHFRKRKRKHWHVDRLTPHATAMAAHIVADGDECDLVAKLSASFAFDSVLRGFGSSDCPICESHLLVWKPPEDRPV